MNGIKPDLQLMQIRFVEYEVNTIYSTKDIHNAQKKRYE
jgi:hypothetical protein